MYNLFSLLLLAIGLTGTSARPDYVRGCSVTFQEIVFSKCMVSRQVGRIMRAIVVSEFGGPDVLKLDTSAHVPKIDADQVLVKIIAAGVNPVETYIREGAYSVLPNLPYTPGNDGAGIVERVGRDVKNLKQGDRVFCAGKSGSGTYAEFTAFNAANVLPLDNRLSFGQGASIGVPYFTAYRALFVRAKAKPGETVLIHGASGAVGIAACQFAKAHGLTVLGTAGTPEGVQLVRSNGATHVFNHRTKDYIDHIRGYTEGEGVDVILEMLANVNLAKDLDLLKYHGRVVVIGSRGKVDKLDPRCLMQKESTVTAVALAYQTQEEALEAGQDILKGIKEGWVNPVVQKEYPLDQAAAAHVDVLKHVGGIAAGLVRVPLGVIWYSDFITKLHQFTAHACHQSFPCTAPVQINGIGRGPSMTNEGGI